MPPDIIALSLRVLSSGRLYRSKDTFATSILSIYKNSSTVGSGNIFWIFESNVKLCLCRGLLTFEDLDGEFVPEITSRLLFTDSPSFSSLLLRLAISSSFRRTWFVPIIALSLIIWLMYDSLSLLLLQLTFPPNFSKNSSMSIHYGKPYHSQSNIGNISVFLNSEIVVLSGSSTDSRLSYVIGLSSRSVCKQNTK